MKVNIYRCLRCGHYWLKTTQDTPPDKCPQCNSERWDDLLKYVPSDNKKKEKEEAK